MGELLLGGRYRLEDLLGTGGTSVVWRARDEVLGRAVAVKVLAGAAPDEAARARVRGEARSAAAVSHPNLAQVFDYGEADAPYVVLELIEGETLERRLATGPVPPAEAFRLCAQVAAGLAAAHAAGLVHRDVKPANIMVTAAGAKLVDFGIAAQATAEPATGPGEVLGTPAYVAPERLTGGAVAPASDVYALGVVLYKLLAGVLPWPGETTTGVVRDHVHSPPEPLPDLPGVPGPVAALCMSCLVKDPAGRPAAGFVADVLARAAARAVLGPPEPPVRTPRWRIALAAGAVVTMAGAWLYSGASPLREPGSGAEPARPARPPQVAPPGSGPSGDGGPATAAGSAGPGGSTDPRQIDSGPSPPPAVPAPSGPPGSTPAPTTAPAGPRTFGSDGGTVTARCSADGRAELVEWAAARSYRVEATEPGPAASAAVTFRHGNDLVVVRVTCPGGAPAAEVTTSRR